MEDRRMYCRMCGNLLDNRDKYCRECGELTEFKISEESAEPIETAEEVVYNPPITGMERNGFLITDEESESSEIPEDRREGFVLENHEHPRQIHCYLLDDSDRS